MVRYSLVPPQASLKHPSSTRQAPLKHPPSTPQAPPKHPPSTRQAFYPSQEFILELLGAISATLVSIFETMLSNLSFLCFFFSSFIKIAFDFKGFSLPRSRFLQYLTMNFMVFAYCSELLRKCFRSFQNARTRPPAGLLEPLWEPMRALWKSKLPPKNPQEAPKASKRTGKWSPRDRQGVPKRPQDIPEGLQMVPKGSPRNPQGSPRVLKGSPRGPLGVPKGDRATKESVE